MSERVNKRLYGRKFGRPLNASRQAALDSMYPIHKIDEAHVTQNADIDPAAFFPKTYNQTWLEIGFGNGERLAQMMERNPDTAYIGCEPFINGVSNLMKLVQDNGCENLRVYKDDAILVVDSLIDGCLDGIYVLNPDPWPKKRHHKRRIISQENLTRFSRLLKPGGNLIMATDVDDLAEWMATQASMHPDFVWTAKTPSDWQTAPKDWIHTRYEQKGVEAGRKQSYLIFRKNT
jgi:tRNA (guanine-N7-)-methyltransferase